MLNGDILYASSGYGVLSDRWLASNTHLLFIIYHCFIISVLLSLEHLEACLPTILQDIVKRAVTSRGSFKSLGCLCQQLVHDRGYTLCLNSEILLFEYYVLFEISQLLQPDWLSE